MKYRLTNVSFCSPDPVTARPQKDMLSLPVLAEDTLSVSSEELIDCSDYLIFPGFADVHVHFREPGFSYKETIASGSAAAARGGYSAVCTMPNLDPTPDSLAHLRQQTERIRRDATVSVIPFGTITKGEEGRVLSDMEDIAPYVCGYSDDGRGVDDTALMEEAMTRAAALGKIIAAHCEDGSAPKDSPEAEWREAERNIKLADKTGASLHLCHISTKETLALVREAKRSGVDVTCETAPHYLTLSERDLRDDGRFRMNPPLRGEADRLALLEGIADGTIDMIATDHAPHSAEEKAHGLRSLNGIVGLECAFPVLYTELVRGGQIPLERLITLMSVAPHARFGLKQKGYSIWELDTPYTLDPKDFLSMGRSTPFEGRTLWGTCMATVHDGRLVYQSPSLFPKP